MFLLKKLQSVSLNIGTFYLSCLIKDSQVFANKWAKNLSGKVVVADCFGPPQTYLNCEGIGRKFKVKDGLFLIEPNIWSTC